MSILYSSVVSALRAANIGFTGSRWLRLKGHGLDAISINAESGGWTDHRSGEHGNFRQLGERLGFNVGGISTPPVRTISHPTDLDKDIQQKQFAKNLWARGVSAVKPKCPAGKSVEYWEKEQAPYDRMRDALYDYLASRSLDPLPLMSMIRISDVFSKSTVDKQMQDDGAVFFFMLPMFTIGAKQWADDGSMLEVNISGVQRTYIKFADESHPVEKVGRRMLGKKGITEIKGRSNPITLPTSEYSVDSVLGAGEGFETVVSFVQSTGYGAIVCWDWTGLKHWSESIIPKENSSIVAFLVDNDVSQTGQRESAAAIRRITDQTHGKTVYLLPPDSIIPDDKGNRDWNDLLQQFGVEVFAAEIVKAWHKSDENFALAPVPVEVNNSSNESKGPKDAKFRQAIAEAQNLTQAQEAIKQSVMKYYEKFVMYAQEMDVWSKMTPPERKASGLKRPKLPPELDQSTTGTGKSHIIRELFQMGEAEDIGILVLTRNHTLAADYASAGAFPYHGRSTVIYEAQPKPDEQGRVVYTMKHVAKNINKIAESDCYKSDIINTVADYNHIPAITVCRECEHGRKYMLDNCPEESKPYQEAEAWMEKYHFSPKEVPACRWLSLQEKTRHKRVVVAPNAAFSESLLSYINTKGERVKRLVIVDEIPDLMKEIEASLADLSTAISEAGFIIKYIQKPTTVVIENDKDEMIVDIETAIGLFKDVAAFMGQAIRDGKDMAQVPDDFVKRVKKMKVEWLPGATARWERAEVVAGVLRSSPLRMAKALIESFATKTAFTSKGSLYLHEVTALCVYLQKGEPALLMDATPSRSVVEVVKKTGGKITQAIAKQHIHLVHIHQYLHGKSWKNNEHMEDEAIKLQTLRSLMQDESGTEDKPVVLTHKKMIPLIQVDEKDNSVGYFGLDDIGQDAWGQKDLLIFGGQMFSPITQAKVYNAELMLMRHCGLKDLPDWSPEVERNQEVTVGDKLVTSKAPLPSDPYLREWVLEDYGRRMAQAIGRVRGVWASPEKPINVWIAGGLPLSGLAAHGIDVNEYRQENHINLNDEKHRETVEKTQVAMAALQAADKDPTYRAINKWLDDHNLPNVRYDVWKTIINIASTTSNEDFNRVVDGLLDAFEVLHKQAIWSESDLSDVALEVWGEDTLPPEYQIAAEIILKVSTDSEKWRSDHPDG